MSNRFPNLHDDPFVTTLANKTLEGFETVTAREAAIKSGLSTTQRKLLELFDALNVARRFETLGLHAVPPRRSLHEACLAVVADPAKAVYLRTVFKLLARAPQSSFTEEENRVSRGLTTGDGGLGQALAVWEPVASDLYNLMVQFGAWRTLGVIPVATGKTKLANVTGPADGYWLTPANQGTSIPPSGSVLGTSISPECATLAALVELSGEALGDNKVSFEAALLMALVEGLNYRMDFTCFQSDGTDDTSDGGMTGIFADPSVPAVTAHAGANLVVGVNLDDFVNAVAAVAPSALQHQPRWWINPAFLPTLLHISNSYTLVDGQIADATGGRLLQWPSGPNDEWRILGFPITWTTGAPSADAGGAKIAAFGRPDAYTVGLRQDFEFRWSAGAKWDKNIWQLRAIARARCIMRDPTSFVVLKLAE